MSHPNAFSRIHLLLIPGLLALAAVFAHDSGLDRVLAGVFYDPVRGDFPAHASRILELLGHRLAKDAVTVVWLALLSATLSTHAWPRWQPALTARRSALWSGVIGMALGPLIVVGLKGLNSSHCPWDLVEFGGGAELTSNWFVSAAEAGHCFPGGHAASGFSLVALYFMARALEQAQLARVVLLLGVLAGAAFSLIRMAQGAHFLSHNLWAAAICWFVAASAFCIEDLQRRQVLQRADPVQS